MSSSKHLRPRLEAWLVGFLLLMHALLASHAHLRHNSTIDESGHLLSGLYAWKRGDLTYYHVNPPLVKMLLSAPLVPAGWELPRWSPEPLPRSLAWLGPHDVFLKANYPQYASWLPWARMVNVLLSLGCGWLIYRWGKQVFGVAPALVALSLWAFSPNALAWAGVCTTDMGTAFFAVAAMYCFRHYLRRPTSGSAFGCGVVLGMAQLAKLSLLVLYPVVIVLWLVARRKKEGMRPRWHHLVLLLFVSLLILNLGYGFQGTGRRLGGFFFQSHFLSGREGGWGNRFHDIWLSDVPVPLPSAYLQGLDEQKSHADRGMPAYLGGEWREEGWWYYYLYAMAVKLPLGTLLLIGLAPVLMVLSLRFRAPVLEEGLIWLPALVLLVLFSSQTGLNAYLRYLLPMFPFLFLGIGRVGVLLVKAREKKLLMWLGSLVVMGALAWNFVSVARHHPHHLSYFNELAGGPERGWEHLIDGNIDWGQDLLLLKEWLEEHPEVEDLYLAYGGAVDPHLLGIEYRLVPQDPRELKPGWYAVSVNYVCGMAFYSHDEEGRRIRVPRGAYARFRRFRPVAKAGIRSSSIICNRKTGGDFHPAECGRRSKSCQAGDFSGPPPVCYDLCYDSLFRPLYYTRLSKGRFLPIKTSPAPANGV